MSKETFETRSGIVVRIRARGHILSSTLDATKARPRPAAVEFLRAANGATAIEFALIAPMLLLTILFLMSIGYFLFMGQALDAATQKAARRLRTGEVQSASLTQDQFRTTIVCPALPSLFDCSNVIVNVQAVPVNGSNHPNEYYNFVNASQTAILVPQLSNSKTSYCPGQAKGYVYVQVLYPANALLGMFSSMGVTTTYNGQQTFLLMATATFLNEPFKAPASSC